MRMMQTRSAWLVVVLVALMASAVVATSSLSADVDESNALRLASLEQELSEPLSFMEVSAIHDSAAAAPTPITPESLQAQWAKEDADRRAARAARIAKEDAEEALNLARLRRAAIKRKKQAEIDAKFAPEGRVVNKAESVDWDAKRYPSPSLFDPAPKAVKKESSVYAKAGDPGCPTCKKRGLKKSWDIVLDPTSVSAIDLPLIQELHHRVDYLVEPMKKKLAVKESLLRAARQQAIDAEAHHIRVYDFGEKHKNQLLIPQYIQDEQKIVQLE